MVIRRSLYVLFFQFFTFIILHFVPHTQEMKNTFELSRFETHFPFDSSRFVFFVNLLLCGNLETFSSALVVCRIEKNYRKKREVVARKSITKFCCRVYVCICLHIFLLFFLFLSLSVSLTLSPSPFPFSTFSSEASCTAVKIQMLFFLFSFVFKAICVYLSLFFLNHSMQSALDVSMVM